MPYLINLAPFLSPPFLCILSLLVSPGKSGWKTQLFQGLKLRSPLSPEAVSKPHIHGKINKNTQQVKITGTQGRTDKDCCWHLGYQCILSKCKYFPSGLTQKIVLALVSAFHFPIGTLGVQTHTQLCLSFSLGL